VEPKPRGWGSDYAAWFDVRSVAERYGSRPPYPAEVFRRLAALAVDQPRAVLDAGCGPGDLARGLAPLVGVVDAIDRSAVMLAHGRELPGGDADNLRWIHGEVESAPLRPRYALVVAGESVHWFDWPRAIPRFTRILSARGVLALVYRDWLGEGEFRRRLIEVYGRHGANPDFVPLDPIFELERRGLFERLGEYSGAGEPWTPTTADLLRCHHSQNGFVLERMRDPAAFDRELTGVVEEFAPRVQGRHSLRVCATLTWGLPARAPDSAPR
jgi:SAM-dependent methyltransferase